MGRIGNDNNDRALTTKPITARPVLRTGHGAGGVDVTPLLLTPARAWGLRCLLLSLCLVGSFATFTQAQTRTNIELPAPCNPSVARVISAQGQVDLRRAGQAAWMALQVDGGVCAGDSVRTGASSRAALALPDRTVTRLDQHTVITFLPPRDGHRTWLEVLDGVIHVITRERRSLRIFTPFANAGIEGTEFLVTVTADRTAVLVLEGRVRVDSAGISALAASGERVEARAGGAPVVATVVRPRDAVHWTLYYPPLPEAAQDTPAGRAAAALAVGRVDEAQRELDAMLARNPDDATALAQRAVIALVQNDAATAQGLAERAVAAAPDDVRARVALSWVRQAAFDLPGALEAAQSAVQAEPGSALARARLAELWLALGDTDQALAEAHVAVRADPMLSLPYTVLGFAHLAAVDTGAARVAFEAAIELDSAAPLPRLGLGLVLIREGDLGAGRAQLEIAVLLDPNNALLRSYMGKTYHDGRQDALAATQLSIARALDPADPTPYFYDAIRKQTTNRPVEALHDVQASVARNDNRAVYRSRLLLDQDLAARSAARGRIWRDLGFGELALREGWQSLSADPGDHSAHRLLADSYSMLPRHEMARVNELLQSQLLQPINLTPIQPQLGEANLFILDSGGPSAIAFNEFNPLFSRDRLAFQTSAVVGGNDTRGVDGVLSGIEGRWSFSLGGYHFETDGFRDNNDLDQEIASAFVQYQFSPSTSLLVEARYTDRESGDLALRFDPANYIAELRQTERSDTLRVGLGHALTPRARLLALVGWQSADVGAAIGSSFATDLDLDGYSAELQYQWRGEAWRLVAGLRQVDRELDTRTRLVISLPFPPFTSEDTSSDSLRTEARSAYAYADIDIGDALVLTLGGSFDSIEAINVDRERFSPKFGLRWQAAADTVVRAGAFRTLQGARFSRQDIQPSLEPTPVAGFNQFYAGSEGEEAWRYGLAVDQRFSRDVQGGVELSARDLDVPFLMQAPAPSFALERLEAEVREYLGRLWLYWTPRDDLALAVAWEYEKFDNDARFVPQGFVDIETHRLPLQARWFHPGGFSAGLRLTFVDQHGTFLDTAAMPATVDDDDDRFQVVDGFIGWRLRGRRGLLSLNVDNLFDSDFSFQDTDPENPRIWPERVVSARVTLAF